MVATNPGPRPLWYHAVWPIICLGYSMRSTDWDRRDRDGLNAGSLRCLASGSTHAPRVFNMMQ